MNECELLNDNLYEWINSDLCCKSSTIHIIVNIALNIIIILYKKDKDQTPSLLSGSVVTLIPYKLSYKVGRPWQTCLHSHQSQQKNSLIT